MSKIVLDNVAGGYALSTINTNFERVEDALNNQVLYRDNPDGEPNALSSDLDANSHRIYNLPEPLSPSEAARLQDVQNAISGATQANLVQFTPSGSISSTNVQAAIEELDGDIQAISDTSDASKGDALVGVKQPFPGSVPRTQHDKNADTINVEDFGAVGDGTGDQRAAIQAAIDAMADAGGGVVYLSGKRQFRLASTATRTVFDAVNGLISLVGLLFLPANVSLIGAGSSSTKLFQAIGGVGGGIITMLDPANQRVEGLELQGFGATNTAAHGIFVFPLTTFNTVMTNVAFYDLNIHDVGSYGLSNQLQCRGVTVGKIKTRNTGADGIDWKVRGTSLDTIVTEAVFFTDIDIADYGKRVGAGTPTGIGIRGLAHIDKISVKTVAGVQPGIDFVAGISVGADMWTSASLSTITNWYVEGADPKGDAIGLRIYACSGVRVGPGVSKWARCDGALPTSSPYGFDDGGMFEGATVIPAHGRTAFLATARGTHFKGARVISDKYYWDAKRQNLTAGQTVLPLPYASTTNGGATRYLVRITGAGVRTVLTEVTDYAWTTNSATLVVGAAADDSYIAVFPPVRGFRLEAFSCSVDGVIDFFCPGRISAPSQEVLDNCTLNVVWEGHQNISQLSSPTILGLIAADPTTTDRDVVLHGQGVGAAILAASTNKLRFFAASGGVVKQTVTGAKGGNAALTSLLVALNAYGLVIDSTT